MKSVKKLLSLLLTLAIIFGVVAVIPATTVSAAPGDVFTVTSLPDNWKWYSSSYVTRENNGAKFGVNANKGNGLDNYGILACNSQSADIIKAGTTYRISLRIETWFTLDKLQVDVDTGTALWSRTKSVTSITDLNNRASDIIGDASSSKLYATVTFNVTTPANISGNQHFVIGVIPKSGATGGVANLRFYNITITELGNYDIVDESGNLLDTVSGLPGDDALTLVNNSEANKGGLEIVSVSPATIAANTTQIVVSYKKAEVEPIVVTFDDKYGTTNTSTHRYYETSADGFMTVKNGSMALKDDSRVPNANTSFGYRAFLLADDFAKGLEAGMSYKLQIQIRTFPQYVPLSQLSAEIKFGSGAWNVASDSPTITFTGKQLESMVTNNPTASANGGVTFEITTYVTVPSSGNHNILLSIYGGSYTVPEVVITPAADISVVDEAGNSLGTVAGLEGEKTADLIPDSLKTDADCVYSTSPEVVEDILTPIVLTKTLKANIAEKIIFNGTDYKGHGDTTTHYYSNKFYKDGGLKGVDVHKGATFGDRAVILANNRSEQNISAGNTYRVKFQLRTTKTNLSNYRIDVAFSDYSVWNTGGTIAYTYSGAEIDTLVKSVITGNTYKYVIEIDVTVPDNSNLKNVVLSVSGIDAAETYWLDNAYIIAQTDAMVSTYNDEYYANVKGFEGDAIGDVISDDLAVKFLDVTTEFKSGYIHARSNNIIFKGDANFDNVVDAEDIIVLRKYLLGDTDGVDAFAVNVNATNKTDSVVDICDLVKLNINIANAPTGLGIEGLVYDDYALAWNYEFDGNSIDYNAIGSASGINELEGLNYVTVGDKNCVNVANGVLNMTPQYNYGHMLASDSFSTKGTMNFLYGYFEIRAKLSYSAANLPAIWFKTDGSLIDTGDGDVLEYDLLETFGATTNFKHNVHYWDSEGNTYNANNKEDRAYKFDSVGEAAQYHVYGFEWYYDAADKTSKITLYVDGVKQGTLSAADINHRWYQDVPEDFDRPMYLILQNQIITDAYATANSSWLAGRGATAADFPMDMSIDYIRIYQSAGNNQAAGVTDTLFVK